MCRVTSGEKADIGSITMSDPVRGGTEGVLYSNPHSLCWTDFYGLRALEGTDVHTFLSGLFCLLGTRVPL